MTPESPPPLEPLILLAEKTSAVAAELKMKTVVIGGMALAHHGYARATEDFDFATYADFSTTLRELAKRLRALGIEVREIAPDADDPIDGTLDIRDPKAPGAVQIVNFRARPGRAVIANATKSDDAEDPFLYVALADLVALKLYAGSSGAKRDVEALLEANPTADLDAIRSACRALDLETALDKILERLKSQD